MKLIRIIIISVFLIFVIPNSFAEIWIPKLWIPKPMESSVTVYILSEENFIAAAFVRGVDPKKGGFSVLNKNVIYLKSNTLHLFSHEVRHLQEGQFHD